MNGFNPRGPDEPHALRHPVTGHPLPPEVFQDMRDGSVEITIPLFGVDDEEDHEENYRRELQNFW